MPVTARHPILTMEFSPFLQAKMKTSTGNHHLGMIVGWTFLPALGLIFGYFIGRLFAMNVSAQPAYYSILLGPLLGTGLGVFGAGFVTGKSIQKMIPLDNRQTFKISVAWLFAFILGMLVTFVLIFGAGSFLVRLFGSEGQSSWLLTFVISYPVGAICGGFLMGITGGFFTSKVVVNREPGLSQLDFKQANLRWGLGFALGELLSSVLAGCGVGYFLTGLGTPYTDIGSLALASGLVLLGAGGSLVGGRNLLKRLEEFSSTHKIGKPASARHHPAGSVN
jgi:hypothetical protein